MLNYQLSLSILMLIEEFRNPGFTGGSCAFGILKFKYLLFTLGSILSSNLIAIGSLL